IYLAKYSRKNILELFSKIKETAPETQWSRILLVGDWNMNIDNEDQKKSQTLNLILKQMGLSIFKAGPTRVGNTLDFFAGNGVKITQVEKLSSLASDHCMLLAELEVPIVKNAGKIEIPDRTAADVIAHSSLKEAH